MDSTIFERTGRCVESLRRSRRLVYQSLSIPLVTSYKWGPYTIDRFASHYNTQLARFNSKYASPGCSWFDVFAQNWSNENNWLCPLVSLIVASARHLEVVKGYGTLIVPEWHSAYFWPFLYSSSSLKPFIKSVLVLPRVSDLLIEGPGQRVIYRSKPSLFHGCPQFNMLALTLYFLGFSASLSPQLESYWIIEPLSTN